MRMLSKALAAFLIVAVPGGAFAEVPRSGNPVFDQATRLIEDNFWQPAELPRFDAAVGAAIAAFPAGGPQAADIRAGLDHAIAALGASHTGYFTPDQLDYYELADIFRFNYRDRLRSLFPPDGRITYPGIGIASVAIDGARFVTDVYDGGPAAKSGLLPGDEIVSADGAPFAEIASFTGKVGETVRLFVRREADAAPFDVDVPVLALRPAGTLIEAISNSASVAEVDGHRIGYLHIWTFIGGDVEGAIDAALTGPLAEAEALVVDLRGRWGGAPPDAAEIFLGHTPPFRFIDRDGTGHLENVRWHKPIVAIIDEGTRSGLEVFAYALKLNGVPLVGGNTAGALLGGRGYMLSDGSLLEIAVAGVELNGEVIEGKGVAPTIPVDFDIRYAAGHDPRRDAATEEAVRLLGKGAG